MLTKIKYIFLTIVRGLDEWQYYMEGLDEWAHYMEKLMLRLGELENTCQEQLTYLFYYTYKDKMHISSISEGT